ncbi:MAG: formylglycine-generating enzyme family protein [Spirochaetales bacterium]|nr:formylglycine-generating enzyme family protein [Spirochaetales bacterium]
MKRLIYLAIVVAMLGMLAISCTPDATVGAITPPYIDTGVDPDSWAVVPAGEFPYGQHDHMTMIDYDYEIMVTDVTNAQYAAFLNEALAAGEIGMGEVVVEDGESVTTIEGVYGYHPGDPFDNYDHEYEIKAEDKLYIPLDEEGLRLTFDGQTFAAIPEYANHPATMVTWFGANAYAEFYGWRITSDMEWEKAARGTEFVDGYGLPFPWGTEIHGSNANSYSSFDLYEKIFGKLGSTTPVGFYNGNTYDGYETRDSPSPYGLYDMAGNVWQWVGDDYPKEHYRYMRGGSYYTYEVDLRVWKRNSAGPEYYSPAVGFRCARDM